MTAFSAIEFSNVAIPVYKLITATIDDVMPAVTWCTGSGRWSSVITASRVMLRFKLNTTLWTGIRHVRFGSKVGQIGPKRDKSGAFSDQISVHLARSFSKNDFL